MCIHVYSPTYGHFIAFKAYPQWLDPAMAHPAIVAQRHWPAAAPCRQRHRRDQWTISSRGCRWCGSFGPRKRIGSKGETKSKNGDPNGDLHDDGCNEGFNSGFHFGFHRGYNDEEY